MRKNVWLPLAIVLTIGLFVACDQENGVEPSSSLENAGLDERGRNPSVSGHVELDSVDGRSQKYTFNAVMLKDGRVKGQFQLFDTYNDSMRLVAHGRVECFTIQDDGQTAWLGGVVIRGQLDSTNYAGAEAYWTVVDNGEGGNADPDEATEIVYSLDGLLAQDHCTDGAGTFVYSGPIVRSNVQVKQ